ncbi:MAG: glutathione S-transferase family protein [Casimicrobium sp.]
MLQLHYFPSNASFTPHILLEEMGVPFELKLVDRASNAHKSAEYLKLNPNGLIPVLVDGDLVLYETAAICLHLVDSHPEKGLAPAVGTPARAAFYKWLMWMTNTLQPSLIMYFYTDRYTTSTDTAEIARIKTKTQERIGAMLKQLDGQLAASGGPWMLGSTFCVLDIYAFMLGRWTRVFDGAPPATQPARDAAAWPNLGPFMQRMLERPAVQRVIAKEGLKPPLI